jgi:YesN/AraC family two-component response regulator
MDPSLRILIVDDQLHARHSLKALLVAKFALAEVREAQDGKDALRCIHDSEPDVVIIDVLMPGVDGVQATSLIKGMQPAIKVIVLSMYREYRAAALSAGADAFVSKGDPPGTLLATLAKVAGIDAERATGSPR